MCLVERSGFGLNASLGRKLSEIEPVGRVSALDPLIRSCPCRPEAKLSGRTSMSLPERPNAATMFPLAREIRQKLRAPTENREMISAVAKTLDDATGHMPG